MFKAKKELWMIILALATLIVCFAPATMAGERVGVKISEPFEVNGDIYPAGSLSLREVSAFSPIATLNEVVVNGRSLGMLIAQDGSRAETAARDELIFSRSSEGHLVLTGVALKGQPVRDLFEYSQDSTGGHWQSATPEAAPVMVATR